MKLLFLTLTFLSHFALSLCADPAKPVPAAAKEKALQVTNVSPDQAEKLIRDLQGMTVLDVRTAEEFAKGHIKGATNVDFFESDFEKRVKSLDPDKPLLIHCASGHRSSQAVEILQKTTKFPAVYHLNDGFNGWKAAKKAVEKAK